MAVELIYETHATSTDNEAGIATGWLPGELSQTGRRQARELGQRHRDAGLAVVFSSDLRRAVDTARLAFDGTGLPYRQDRRLRECDYGELNGAPVALVTAQRRRRIDEPFPGGESYQQVVDRTAGFLADLMRDWDGRRVLAIAHSANLWALEVLVHGRRLTELLEAPVRVATRLALPSRIRCGRLVTVDRGRTPVTQLHGHIGMGIPQFATSVTLSSARSAHIRAPHRAEDGRLVCGSPRLCEKLSRPVGRRVTWLERHLLTRRVVLGVSSGCGHHRFTPRPRHRA